MKKCFSVLKETTKRFYKDRVPDYAAIISYYALLAALPLLGVLLFFITKFVSSQDLVFKALHLLTKDIFIKVDPSFFGKTKYLANLFSKMGLYGLFASVIIGFYLFSKTIYFINVIFKARHCKKATFWMNRLKELVLMLVAAILFFSSFVMTNFISTFKRFISSSPLGKYVNPSYIRLFNNFMIRFFIPFFLTFLFFLIIYKMIPHIHITGKAAIIAAFVTSFIWELAKWIFSWYFAKIAIYGRIHGTLTVIVVFVVLVDLGFSILFWGVELTYVLNVLYLKRKNEA